MVAETTDDKAKLRIARFLAGGAALPRPAAKAHAVLLEGDDRGTVSVLKTVFEAMLRDGLFVRVGDRLALSEVGAAWLKRRQAVFDPLREQHAEVETTTVDLPAGKRKAMINTGESPLALLSRRKTRHGQVFLAEAEVRAGERLRADYTKAQIMPRLGANWQASVASGRRGGSAADITDAAVAARQRVDKAIHAVGPELAGLLVDVCCFLKGLETVESERGWPARSAKIVLKAGLAALARHYDPPASVRAGKTRHWGSAGYRPTISA